ncbi:MAG: hypothetical protein JW841_06430 [Deltaproteobacteria bacterium]|nr:hypothetical protein [Deltaproteobacteria bacterium]
MVQTAITTSKAGPVVRNAVTRLREVCESGDIKNYLAVDRKSGEPMHQEARQLFASLPAVTPDTNADEIVDLGLWSSIPHNLRRALEMPRYRVGREIFVRTNASHRVIERLRPVGNYDTNMPLTFTHRAQLCGQMGDYFVALVDGAPKPLRFLRSEVYAWNEPTPIPQSGSISGVQFDYNDPLLKAHICAAFVELEEEAGNLDFNEPEEKVRSQQIHLIRRITSRVQMNYAGRSENYAGANVGALLSYGQGVCFTQRAVALILLAPFCKSLGFDLQAAIGRTLRLGVPHGFAIVVLRPSLSRYVVDPAWGEPLTDLRVAFFGPVWGQDRQLVGLEGSADTNISPEAIDLPEITVS